MEASPCSGSTKGAGGKRALASPPVKDLWAAVQCGTPADVDAALASLKKNNGSIDVRNAFGSTALHIAVWRNHIPIMRRLLAAGADTDIRDGESGWTSLHRALHFGHLAVAGVLIEAGASLLIEDFKGRTPIDLISGPVKQALADASNAGGTEVFSWGNGANYQLGTGTVGVQKVPCRLDSLQGLNVTAIAAAKFHSMAITADGKLYSWGFGRGGRLGHSDFDIHSGQAAVITPQLVSSGIGTRKVKFVAVAKHHSIVVTEGGEVFTWGSNREGQLGYTSVDTQPTPRRVTAIKARVVAAAAANRHSAVIIDAGEVFTWGCNREGQLGYGTSNSASNPIPRAVEYLKGKKFSAVSAAKYHTVALGLEGEVFTWGYKMVTPKRVSITRNTRKAGNVPLKFHQVERLHIAHIAAGTKHSSAVSEDGLVFYWLSADPHLHCQQLMCMAAHHAVGVAAGKFRTAIVTSFGDIYAWDGEKMKTETPVPVHIQGIKHACNISVGENHSLAIASVYTPKFPPQLMTAQLYTSSDNTVKDLDDSDEVFDFDAAIAIDHSERNESCADLRRLPVEPPSLKELCENVVCQQIVEPKNALQILEVADSLGASKLRKHCEEMVLHNLDYILAIAPMAFTHASPMLLADVEKALDATSSEAWSHRLLPTPTALFPAVVESEEDDNDPGFVSRRRSLSFFEPAKKGSEGIFHQESELDQARAKQVRALKKKLQQIEALELKQLRGHKLDHQQEAKLLTKQTLIDTILAIESGDAKVSKDDNFEASGVDDFREKVAVSRKQHNVRKKKNKSSIQQSAPESFFKEKVAEASKLSNGKAFTSAVDPKIDNSVFVQSIDNEDVNSTSNDASGVDTVVTSEKNGVFKVELANSVLNNEGQVKIHGFVAELQHNVAQESLLLTNSGGKKKNRKGALSMFLTGALDKPPPTKVTVEAPIIPKVEGPAWGGIQRSKGLASLRDIQSQQIEDPGYSVSSGSMEQYPHSQTSLKILKGKQVTGGSVKGSRNHSEPLEAGFDATSDAGTSRISLQQFIRTSPPITVASTKAIKVIGSGSSGNSPTPWLGTSSSPTPRTGTANSPTPWAGSSSPLTSASSFRDIQVEQVKGKTHKQSIQGSPKPGSSASFNLSEKGVDEKVANRWYKPDTRSPSSIRNIQIEEEAIKHLQRMYKNTKVVRAGDPR